jgi:hypothetical protein
MEKYGLKWADGTDLAAIEMKFIQSGGYIQTPEGKFGKGLFHHYRELQILLWPDDQHHRWTDQMLGEILGNRISVIAGCRDSGKTHVALARYGLTDYFCFPNNTLILMSSTHAQGIQLRVYGDVKDLLTRARELRPWLPGNIVESKYGIFTDALSAFSTVRDMRKGIICVPCTGGDGEWLEGLEKFIGVKQQRRRLLGDEVQFMAASYLNVMSNLDKGDFKGVFCGNFLGRGDPLDRLAEPLNGWSSIPEPKKTTAWENKLGGRTLNLVGTDSPNFDFPKEQPARYPYLISWDDVDRVKRRYGENSLQFWSQIKGVRKSDLMLNRILTIEICRQFGAFDECVWSGDGLTKVYALDAAFGGDRAVGGMVEFGQEVGGKWVIKCHEPRTIPIEVVDTTPEEQLSRGVKKDCDTNSIPATNVFFDAGMRATLGVNMANVVGLAVNAVNFGGPATTRPVSKDDYVKDNKTGERRLKRCDEAYSKFVTEINWSVRMVVESRQMRAIPEEVVREFEMREWTTVSNDRIELETKAETKKRMGASPDLADWMAIAVEGCRRLGFEIEGLKSTAKSDNEDRDWLEKELGKFKTFKKKYELKYG